MPVLLAQTAQPDAGRQPQPFTQLPDGRRAHGPAVGLDDLLAARHGVRRVDIRSRSTPAASPSARRRASAPTEARGRRRRSASATWIFPIRDASGTPFVLPGVLGWERMDIATGALPVGLNSPGPVVTLVPSRPAAAWTRSIEFFGAPRVCSRGQRPRPRRRLRASTGGHSASLLASGPVIPGRLGMVLSAAFTNSHSLPARRSDPALATSLASCLTHLVFTPTHARRSSRHRVGSTDAIAVRPPARLRPAGGRRSARPRFTCSRSGNGRETPNSLWTGFASFSARRRTTDLEPRRRHRDRASVTTGPSRICSRRSEPTGPGRSAGS